MRALNLKMRKSYLQREKVKWMEWMVKLAGGIFMLKYISNRLEIKDYKWK